jgi:hypothetical protein
MTAIRTSTSPAWLVRLHTELDAAEKRANDLVKPLSSAQLNWSARPGAWSIGQCLQHLAVSNEVYVAPLAEALRVPATGPVQEVTPGWFARYFIRNYIAPSNKMARAPGKIAPREHIELSVLDRFVQSNQTVRDLADLAQDHDVNRIRFVNPFIPVKLFTVGTAFEIVWQHEARHLLQAERMRAEPGFPAT